LSAQGKWIPQFLRQTEPALSYASAAGFTQARDLDAWRRTDRRRYSRLNCEGLS